MPGFNLSLGIPYDFFVEEILSSNLVFGEYKKDHYQVNRFTLNKFLEDKIFSDNQQYLIVLEGVILNKKEIEKKYSEKSWSDVIWKMYSTKGDQFFSELLGSFSGALYDKLEDKWLVYGDHIGSKHLYYSIINNGVCISSELSKILELKKKNNIPNNINTQAAYMLLTYGFLLDDNTLESNVKKLLPGHYLVYKNSQLSLKKYYHLPEAELSGEVNESQTVDELDDLFRGGIDLQFKKDEEYNYKSLVALSGGLDSRMTSWVAHEMGYTNQLNFTFSQSNYLDEEIAKEIAADLKHEWIFKALDNGLFLKDIDEINRISGGNALYYGLAHNNSLLKYLNFDKLGILHSGQLGDVILGSYLTSTKIKTDFTGLGAYSERLLSKLQPQAYNVSHNNQEVFMMYQRGFNGINTGLLPTQNFTETISPFCNLRFFEYCFNLPANVRMHHYIYKKWILKKYPKAANYKWESINKKINSKNISINLFNKSVPIDKILSKVLQKAGLKPKSSFSKFHMNPLDYWYHTNLDIKKFQDNYFTDNIERLSDLEEMKLDCERLYNEGSAIEKNQVLSLLSALKLFF